MNDISQSDNIQNMYKKIIENKYPKYINSWPIASGYRPQSGKYNEYNIIIYKHFYNSLRVSDMPISLNRDMIGFANINKDNKAKVRENLFNCIDLNRKDAILIFKNEAEINEELEFMLRQHEIEMGVIPMKIFLSHKSEDKPMVKRFKKVLETIGYDIWYDDDSMAAGENLNRGILQGIKESCAIIFFLTPEFKDKQYLKAEIDYALKEKTGRDHEFAIITLLFEKEGKQVKVPDLLETYVFKNVESELEGLDIILKALPIVPKQITWR
ncbi:MAG: toll/interleukin-1 receptor domain-containing protein [Candidatus Muirbacterium halophilum]|nr:toll/interleukin-1 receptor domain-containing protein [Candidatus Muirbacterium halophilum]MCK9471667.1 toll/interleukin-1 receptor domain-containing protein [Bacilli bacterium]